VSYCGECGGRLEAGNKYCTACGNPLGSSVAETQSEKSETVSAPVSADLLRSTNLSPDSGGLGSARSSKAFLVWIGVALLMICAGAYLMLPLSDRSTEHSPPVAATKPFVADVAAVQPAPPPPPAIDPDNLVTTDGMMGVKAGQNWSSVSSRFNSASIYEEGLTDNCDIYESLNKRVSVMVEGGKVTRIETDDREFLTPSLVGVGSDLVELKKAYGSRLTSEDNPYSGKDYFLEGSDGNGIKFHIEGGKVAGISVGGSSIRYVEGCL